MQHGGLVRASNSGISCRKEEAPQAEPCAEVKKGAAGVNSDFEMFYSEVDKDPDTYNSTRAELKVPQGAKVSYARLYWGGNLRVGEQKPPEDNGRVLVAEPGGAYKEVLADTVMGHRTDAGSDAYQASADVTPLVRKGGAGMWTVAQLNIAMGHSEVGAWADGRWSSPMSTRRSRCAGSPCGTASRGSPPAPATERSSSPVWTRLWGPPAGSGWSRTTATGAPSGTHSP
ncbi:hypothetical protein WKI68_26540 [Streptomyces sp. MS1.HAVA.3]|uniref:DUF3344 domain-containing protein n=1 Tax=Streptomyces caledonius TaxID=3134107 RepID=A0ABU8U7U7_9ACTN